MKSALDNTGVGVAKGLLVTLRHLVRRPITTQYPEERLVTSKRIRGYELVWLPDRCTGCATCAKSCPQGEIKIVTSRRADNFFEVERFEIDAGHCIFCGLCVESCPYTALYMGRNYENASYRRRELIVSKERMLPLPDKPASAYFRPAEEAKLPEQTLLVYGQRKGKA